MKRVPILLAIAHTLLLGAFTAPAHLVPARVRYWAQAYAGVLFNQDWRLFAPDPPACPCALEVVDATGRTVRPDALHDHFIWRRMSANACRFAEAARGNGPVPAVLLRSIAGMAAIPGDAAWHPDRARAVACGNGPLLPLNAPPVP